VSEQTIEHEHWLAERKKGIGGSDAASILSEGYGCPRALFYDKAGVEPDYQHTPAELDLFDAWPRTRAADRQTLPV
jgi:predicted phage-related endonuclease